MENDMKKNQIPRPPVVTIMGHIDHGKSTLLDYIRKSNVVKTESGGITQHLLAYEVNHTTPEGREQKITFLDTPGHEAFAAMRSRGARAADIAVLVVSAEDGVKQQTLEALQCIKDAGIPFVVAINKIDKPGADVERTKQDLAQNTVYLEGYGGDIPFMPISAKTGEGVSELLDIILLVAELAELVGDPSAAGSGVVIESHVDPKRGMCATLIITDGVLKRDTFVVAGESIAPVRIMEDFLGTSIREARFSSPVRVVGFNILPPAGSPFTSYAAKKEAEARMGAMEETTKTTNGRGAVHESADATAAIIPLIIKADAQGSVEAIVHEIEKRTFDRVVIKILATGVGAIAENDVRTGGGNTQTIIIGFHVKVERSAAELAEREKITIETFTVIYTLLEWLEKKVTERIPKTKVEERRGLLKVLKTFSAAKDKQVIGGQVLEGTIARGEEVKILRRDAEIGRGAVLDLQQQKARVASVSEGNQCGLQVQSKVTIAPGDQLESFALVEK